MINLIDLEKKINSELTTKINKTSIKHDQIYVEIDKDDFIDVVLFIKTNKLFTGLPLGLTPTESKVNEASTLTILLPSKSTG